MRFILLFVFANFIWLGVKGQNYIYNAGFDSHTLCPSLGGWITPPWDTYCCASTFDTCATYFSNYPSAHLPNNFDFYQQTIEGSGFGGLYTYSDYIGGVKRGYLYQKFRLNLSNGKRYYIGYNVSLMDRSLFATNALGISLSSSIPTFDTILPFFHQTMQMVNTTINLTDTMKWQKLSWVYTANGGERYILLGNNRSQSNIDTVRVGIPWTFNGFSQNWSVYLIENVFLIPVTGQKQLACSNTNNITLQGSVWGKEYLWSNGDTAASTTISNNGIYTLTTQHDSLYRVDTFQVFVNSPIFYNFLPTDTLLYPGDSIALTAPGSINDLSYNWSTGEQTPSIIIDSGGFYTLTITAHDGCTVTDTCWVRTDVGLAHSPWGRDGVGLIPNPNNGSFSISSSQATYNNVIIYSIDGKEVYNNKLVFTKGNANFDLDLPNGVYQVKLIGSSGVASQKLVISK